MVYSIYRLGVGARALDCFNLFKTRTPPGLLRRRWPSRSSRRLPQPAEGAAQCRAAAAAALGPERAQPVHVAGAASESRAGEARLPPPPNGGFLSTSLQQESSEQLPRQAPNSRRRRRRRRRRRWSRWQFEDSRRAARAGGRSARVPVCEGLRRDHPATATALAAAPRMPPGGALLCFLVGFVTIIVSSSSRPTRSCPTRRTRLGWRSPRTTVFYRYISHAARLPRPSRRLAWVSTTPIRGPLR